MKKIISLLLVISCLFLTLACSNQNEKTKEGHTHNYVEVKANDPTCTEVGNIRFFVCDCGKFFDADKKEIEKSSTILAALGHDMTHVDGVATTELKAGILEHYHCNRCNKDFSDEEGKNELTTVVIPIEGHTHNAQFVDKVDATCTEDGHIAYYYCAGCDKMFEDSECTKELTDVKISKHHDTELVEGVAATCEEEGLVPHFHCKVCGKDFADPDGAVEIDNLVLAKLNHNLTKIDGKEATCTEKGELAHYHCSLCNKDFEDEEATKELTNLEIDFAGHKLAKVDEVKVTCTSDGVKEHYHCDVCNKDFDDAEGKVESTDLVIKSLGHQTTLISAKEATCTEKGELAHYHCSACNKDFEDSACTKELTNLEIAALGHKATLVNGKEATCTEDGELAHYHCSACNKDFEDNACTKELTNLVVKATGHDYQTIKENEVAATCTVAGSYDLVTKCSHCSDEQARETKYTDALGHTWGEGVATTPATCTTAGTMTYTCSVCHGTKTGTIPATGHNYQTIVVDPTCTADGYTLHKCSNCEESYKDTPTTKLGHSWDHEATCTTGSTCTRCQETAEALGHNYVLSENVAATCTTDGYEVHKCTRCQDEINNKTTDALGHDFTGVSPTEKLIAGQTCQYEIVYECKTCHEEVSSGTVYHHNHVATVTQEATCKETGVKTYTCSLCNDTYTESIPVNELGHNWVTGEVNNGKRTDECSICHETKEVTVYTGEAVDANELKDQEIELTNASLKLDDGVIETIGNKEITLTVDKFDDDSKKEELGLTPEQLAQVGSNPIYDFSMKSGEDLISQFGENNFVTITLPYTLAPGEDVDSIAVWYINDSGELDSIQATYSNGYITFQTNHFSYYTVTKLTPAERCALYGHNYATKVVAGDCVNDGYTLYVCQRCHETHKEDVVTAPGHDYQLDTANSTATTCTKNGIEVYECSHCHKTYINVVLALGHDFEEIEKVEATCEEQGYTLYKCSRCGKEQYEYVDALCHNYVETTVPATCTDYGYTLHKCSICGHEYVTDEVEPLGHDYFARIKFADDHLSATATIICRNNITHNFNVDCEVVITVYDATCAHSGDIVYTAFVEVEGKRFEESYTVEGVKLDHTPAEMVVENRVEPTCTKEGSYDEVIRCSVCGEILESKHVTLEKIEHDLGDLIYDANGHYHECSMCHQEFAREEHTFTETIVTQATCGSDGLAIYECSCGYKYEKVLKATGEHNYVDGVCTVCGKEYVDCDHTHLHQELIDFSQYGACGGMLSIFTCDCGEVVEIDQYNGFIMCQFNSSTVEQGETEDGYRWMRATCPVCGLTEYEEQRSDSSEDCLQTYSIYFEFSINGVVIFAGDMDYSNNSHRSVTYTTIPVGTNGSYLRVNKCSTCGEITSFSKNNFYPKGNWTESEEKTTLSDGSTQIIERLTSADMDAYVEYKAIYEKDGCLIRLTETYTAVFNGEVIFTYTTTDEDHEHDYEYTYTMFGETCDDGYILKGVCKDCGYIYVHDDHGHNYMEHDVDLSEHGFCESVISYSVCDVCGEVECNLNYFDCHCEFDFENAQVNEYTENGIAHKIETYTCTKCGGTIVLHTMTEVKGCVTTIRGSISFSKDDYTLEINNFLIEEDEAHEWVNGTIELNNPEHGCEDGYHYTRTCSICGKEETVSGYGHKYDDRTIKFDDYGCCPGELAYSQCTICGAIETHYSHLDCKFGEPTQFTYVDDNGITHECTKQTCSICGLVMTVDMYTTKENCLVTTQYDISYSMNNAVFFSVDGIKHQSRYEHDYVITYTFDDPELGCEGGYTVSAVCKECNSGYRSHGIGHSSYSKEDIESIFIYDDEENVLLQFNYVRCKICGEIEIAGLATTSACDETAIVDNNYQLTEGDVTYDQGQYYKSETYGIEYYWLWYTVVESECVSRDYNRIIIKKNGEVLFDDIYVQLFENHNIITEYTFNTPDHNCNDGYHYKNYCTICGKVFDEGYNYNHENSHDHIELINDNHYFMGSIDYEYCSVCEKIMYFDYYLDEGYFDVTTSTETIDGVEYFIKTYTNSEIGFTLTAKTYDEFLGEYCKYNVITIISFTYNEKTFEGRKVNYEERHEFETVIVFDDPDLGCEGGYTETLTCAICGHTYEQHNSYHSYKSDKFTVSSQCGDLTVNYDYCEYCGKITYIDCDSEYYIHKLGYETSEYVDDAGLTHHVTTQTCNCGYSHVIDIVEEEGPNCLLKFSTIHKFYVGDILIKELVIEEKSYLHESEYVYTLYGDTCDEGWTCVATCTKCGNVTREFSGKGHYYDYSSEQIVGQDDAVLAMLEKRSCQICGDIEYLNIDFQSYVSKSLSNTVETIEVRDGKEYHIYTAISTKFNLTYIVEIYEEDLGNCKVRQYIYYKLYEGENLLVNENYNRVVDKHDFDEVIIFNDEEEGCYGGYKVQRICKVCGYDESFYDSGHRYLIENNYIYEEHPELSGFYIRKYTCEICGEVRYEYDYNFYTQYTYNYYVDNDGHEHEVNVETNEELGFRLQKDTCIVREGCLIHRYVEYLITLNGEALAQFTREYSEYEHTYLATFVFDEGATSCEDGVTVTKTCCVCGDSYSYHTYYHESELVEIIDFEDYGCAHAGKAYHYSCGCGASSNVYVGDTECDFHQEYQYINLNDEDFIDGYRYVYTCASTDPLCNFSYAVESIRRYKEDGSCVFIWENNYLFGYNSNNQTGLKKITYITGGYDTYHNFSYQDGNELTDQYLIRTSTKTCTRCGETESFIYYYDIETDLLVKYEHIARNLYEYELYQIITFGNQSYNMKIEEYYEYEGYWSKKEISYPVDFCHGHVVETDSNGERYEYEMNDHLCVIYIAMEEGSCSQIQGYGYMCTLCDDMLAEFHAPLDHNFYYDEAKDVYVCSRCGLESATGVSGSIIMEDMSNEEYYIIGYFNRTHVQFLQCVSILFGDDEIFLTNDDVYFMNDYEGTHSVYFYKDSVDYFARNYFESHEMDPDTEYRVKFAFVPFGADSNYDYAIVFE